MTMKKQYIIPTTEVVKFNANQSLLAGSLGVYDETTDTQFSREFDTEDIQGLMNQLGM